MTADSVPSDPIGSPPGADPVALFARMWRIRAFEEKASELYARGQIRGLLHLGIGQEGIAVGAAAALRGEDVVFGTHRSHAHALAKGADPVALFAELAGRTTGSGGGKGGSMHIAFPAIGFMTATGVVGGNIPLALGAAYASVVRDDDRVALVAFGDGAGQTGAFHESLNIASLWRLPVVLLCENNGYAEFTPLSAHTRVERLAVHAGTYGIPAQTVDGNDVLAVRDAVAAAADGARSGGGPRFVEALTYRLRGHYEGDPAKYRELSELSDWRAKDPLAVVRTRLEADGLLDAEGATAAAIEGAARSAIETAVTEALAGPVPSAADVTTDVYAGAR